MIEVFRIEHSLHGGGPFTSESIVRQRMNLLAEEYDIYPLPVDDGLAVDKHPWYWKFACLSMADLRHWAMCERDPQIPQCLSQVGFVIINAIIDSDSYVIGRSGKQVLCDVDSAKEEGLAEILPLNMLLDQ